MTWWNWTSDADFILAGLSSDERIQTFMFVIFLLFYLISLCGNFTIIVTIWSEHKLHTPMYFFLGNLSFLDICYSSVTVPKLLLGLAGGSSEISYRGCMAQLYFYVSCCSTECLLLSIMGFDRYVAICDPMHYTIIMNKPKCLQLAVGLWLVGFTTSVIHTTFTARLPYCNSHRISHFFCDIPPMLELACSDTFLNKILILTAGGFLGLSSFLLTLVSYIQIILTILKIQSNIGRRRAFSTCASHLMVVIIFFGSISFMYMRPTSSYSLKQDQLVSLLYAVVTPALNPIIYTLRNKEVKFALKKKINQRLNSTYLWKHYILAFFKEFG
ncbi:olfactory receptor 5V1-like [Lithobates pipiens]